jgi:hypothetical protein
MTVIRQPQRAGASCVKTRAWLSVRHIAGAKAFESMAKINPFCSGKTALHLRA